MLMMCAKYKINDRAWFTSKTGQLVYGCVQLITIAIKEFESNIWYSFVDQYDNQYTVKESEVLDYNLSIPTPKYRVGDEVEYELITKDKEQIVITGVIERIEIGIYDNKDEPEILYYMDDDPNYHVLEYEIVGFLGTTKEAEDKEEQTEMGYNG